MAEDNTVLDVMANAGERGRQRFDLKNDRETHQTRLQASLHGAPYNQSDYWFSKPGTDSTLPTREQAETAATCQGAEGGLEASTYMGSSAVWLLNTRGGAEGHSFFDVVSQHMLHAPRNGRPVADHRPGGACARTPPARRSRRTAMPSIHLYLTDLKQEGAQGGRSRRQ